MLSSRDEEAGRTCGALEDDGVGALEIGGVSRLAGARRSHASAPATREAETTRRASGLFDTLARGTDAARMEASKCASLSASRRSDRQPIHAIRPLFGLFLHTRVQRPVRGVNPRSSATATGILTMTEIGAV